jgi:hypothetical protein
LSVQKELSLASTVQLRLDRFEKISATAGLRTLAAQAAHCNLTEGGLSKIKAKKYSPSGRSIGSIMAAFPQWNFEDLFEVVPSGEPEAQVG